MLEKNTYKRSREVYNRGPLGVIVMNAGTEPFRVVHGERIAQMVVAPVLRARFTQVDALPDSARGEGGFGSTGRM